VKSFRQFISEAKGARQKGWGHTSGKLVVVNIRGGFRPYHVEILTNNPKAFGLKESMLLKILEKEYGIEEDQAQDMLDDLKSGRQDKEANIEHWMFKGGWAEIVIDDGNNSIYLGPTAKARDLHKVAKGINRKYSDKQLFPDPSAYLEVGGSYSAKETVDSLHDWRAYIKTGKIPRRSEIGSTMAQFREGYGHTLWIDPKGKVHDMGDVANNTHYQWASNNWSKYFGKGKIDDKGNASGGGNVYDTPMQKGWARVRNHNREISVEVDLRKLNRPQKKTLKNVVDGGRNINRPMYIDVWKKNKTSRAGDKAYNDYEEISDFLSESFRIPLEEKPAKLGATFPYKGAKYKNIRGLENPTEREVMALLSKAKRRALRWISDPKGRMLVWDAMDALHDEVAYAEGWKDPHHSDRDLTYAKGSFEFEPDSKKIVSTEGRLQVMHFNDRVVGSDFPLKNRLMKALAKRINEPIKSEKRIIWKHAG
jgi:hypothetical protein